MSLSVLSGSIAKRRSFLTSPVLPVLVGLSAALLATPVQAQTIFVATDRTIAGANPVTENATQVIVGYDGVNFVSDVDADVLDSTFSNVLSAYMNSNVNIINTTVTNNVFLFDTSVTNFQSGSLGPAVSGTVYVTENAQFHMTGGTLNSLNARDNSVVTINNGTIRSAVAGRENAQVTVSGGTFGEAGYTTLEAGGTSSIIVNGGTFLGDVFADQQGTMTISGGSFASLYVWGEGAGASLYLNGTDLALSVGVADNSDFYNRISFILSGTLSDGTALNTPLGVFVSEDDGDTLISRVFFNGVEQSITASASTPEPATIGLIALGLTLGIGIARRHRGGRRF